MRWVIAGTRTYDNEDIIRRWMGCVYLEFEMSSVVVGGAPGVDTIARRIAEDWGLPVCEMKADWAKLGRAAGPIRNGHMAHLGEALLAFWDGKSPGTANMIKQMRALEKQVVVIYV